MFSTKSGEKVTAIERPSSVLSKNFFRARHILYNLSVLKKDFSIKKEIYFRNSTCFISSDTCNFLH